VDGVLVGEGDADGVECRRGVADCGLPAGGGAGDGGDTAALRSMTASATWRRRWTFRLMSLPAVPLRGALGVRLVPVISAAALSTSTPEATLDARDEPREHGREPPP
jgi:hypothetical protein